MRLVFDPEPLADQPADDLRLGTPVLLPQRIRERLKPPDRARNEKITVRFTEGEFDLLRRLAAEREECVSALVRKLALAVLGAGQPA